MLTAATRDLGGIIEVRVRDHGTGIPMTADTAPRSLVPPNSSPSWSTSIG
jgi:hypothetical protein